MKIKEHYYITEYFDGWCVAVYEILERKGYWPFRFWKSSKSEILYRCMSKEECLTAIENHSKSRNGHEVVRTHYFNSHGKDQSDRSW